MLRKISLAMVCVFGCASFTEGNSLMQEKTRDLSSYEKAGPYVIPLMVDGAARGKLEAKVRQFVWEHWQGRRRGYLSITKYSKEGEPSTSHFFIEPENDGAWRVAVLINRVIIERHGVKGQLSESITYDAYLLERVEVRKPGLSQSVLLPDSEVREPESYQLRLKDQKGKVLTVI